MSYRNYRNYRNESSFPAHGPPPTPPTPVQDVFERERAAFVGGLGIAATRSLPVTAEPTNVPTSPKDDDSGNVAGNALARYIDSSSNKDRSLGDINKDGDDGGEATAAHAATRPLASAVSRTGLADAVLAPAPRPEWGPPAKTGWVGSHNMIRRDMFDCARALALVEERCAKAERGDEEALLAWQADNLETFWGYVATVVRHHHDHEETLFFPRMAELGIEIPARLSDDHAQLVRDLEAATVAVKALCAGIRRFNGSLLVVPRPTAVRLGELASQARAALQTLCDGMLPHLLEEERVALPLMLAHSSPKDYQKQEKKMLKEFAWWELPHFYRGFTKEARIAHATGKGMNIPKFVITYVLAGKFKKYEKQIKWLIDELLDPKLVPIHDEARAGSACCTIS